MVMTTSSSEGTGAASAAPLARATREGTTPALSDQWYAEAMQAIEMVDTVEQANELLNRVTIVSEAVRVQRLGEKRERDWRGVKIRAEHKYGELLGPARVGGNGSNQHSNVTASNVATDGAERATRARARRLAAVPQPEVDQYLDTAETPSRDGLLREHNNRARRAESRQERTVGGRTGLSHDPQVIDWVRGRLRNGDTRAQVVADSRAGRHGYPGGSPLTNGGMSEMRAVIAAIERTEQQQRASDPGPTRPPRQAGSRLRQLYAERRSSGQAALNELRIKVMKAVSALEAVEVADVGITDEEHDNLSDLRDDLAILSEWLESATAAVNTMLGEQGSQNRLQLLKARANDPSSTQNEREAASRAADRLRRRSA